MMRWKGRRESDNVEDRRGGGGAKVGGISVIGLVVAFVGWKFFGMDPTTTYQATKQITQNTTQTQQSAPAQETAQEKESREFVSTILADTEDTWTPIFQQIGKNYTQPKLVLYSGVTQTACGTGQSAMGPFYCPSDQKVYLDTDFFKEMRTQLGISGNKGTTELSRNDQAGDFALAYVISHEIGHHVQTLLGITQKVNALRSQVSEVQANQLSVKVELQADCFAGIWANKNQERTKFLDEGDIAEAMDAAEKIGDDYLQKKSRGTIVPDSFTHGTSAQRERWFQRGYQSGDLNQCDTFNASSL